jgi:HlyD family secretion protein
MNGKKILLVVIALLVIAGLVVGTIIHSRSDVPAVTTTKAVHEDLVATISGTGQIKPKTYVNVGATSFGRITHLYVKEGDHVKAGTVVATVENVQPEATVSAQQATISSSRTDVTSYIAAEKTAAANVDQAKADLEQKRLDFGRAQQLYNDKLIAKQDFDSKKAAFDVSLATVAQRQASLEQAVATQRANYDALDKTVSRAPFDALVTNVPVREGETVVVGIQNATGSTLMTLADMSVITAEVKVDETDIVNVAMNQSADVTVDALPGKVFKGHVTEVGDQALLRTTGVATSQSTTGTEEAKDFKVVVTLDPGDAASLDALRPGLSCTAKITTARRPNALTIPIQALVQRDLALETQLFKDHGKASTTNSATSGKKDNLVQGVYLLKEDHGRLRVDFIPVTTGVTGTTDIEVLGGLKDGDEIVTGRYKILRTLKSGTAVKRDNSVLVTTTDDSTS